MCDNNNGYTTDFVNSGLDYLLVVFVESGGSFIKNKHLWLFDEGACESEALLLATAELVTASTDVCVHTIRLFGDEAPRIRSFQSFFNFIIGCVGFAHLDVFFNRRVEKNRFLGYITDLASIVSQINRFEILAVDSDSATLFRVVETLN